MTDLSPYNIRARVLVDLFEQSCVAFGMALERSRADVDDKRADMQTARKELIQWIESGGEQ